MDGNEYDAAYFARRGVTTALDMVKLVPGFSFSVGDPARRGYAAAAGNVLIDGQRPADKQFALDDVLARIPSASVARIEVIRGSRPGIDMLGQIVVVNVVLLPHAADSSTFSMSDAQFRDGRNAPSATIETVRHFAGGKTISAALSITRYVEVAEGNGRLVRVDAAGTPLLRQPIASSAGGTTAYGYGKADLPWWNGKLALNASLAVTSYRYDQGVESDAPSQEPAYIGQRLGGPLGGLLKGELGTLYTRQVGAWTSETNALLDVRSQTFSSVTRAAGSTLFDEREHGGEGLLRSGLRRAASRRVTVQASAEGAFNWLGTKSGLTADGVAVPLPNARADISEARLELSGEVIWTPTRALQVDTGLNLEHSHISAEADTRRRETLEYPKPRLVVTRTGEGGHQLHMRIEREIGQLDLADFVASSSVDTGRVSAGATAIVPQRAWVFELGYERHFWGGAVASLTVRRLLLDEVVDRLPLVNPDGALFDAPGNIGGGRQDVAVVDLTLPLARIGIPSAELKVAGTFKRSRVIDPTTHTPRPLSGELPAEFSVAFRQDVPAWRASWGLTLASPCAASATAKGCESSQFRFDEIDRYEVQPALGLFAEYHPSPKLTVKLEGRNILAQRYTSIISLYAESRSSGLLNYAETRRMRSSSSIVMILRAAI